MRKKFSLSVSEFAVASPLIGSIDTYSGYSEGKEIGIQLHKEIQVHREKENPFYTSEVPIKHTFKYKNYLFEVRGRIDGVCLGKKNSIEEIKSTFNLTKLHNYILSQIETHPFCLQLLTYGYIHWLKNHKIPLLNLHLVSSRNKKTIDLALDLNINQYEAWLERRLSDLITQIKLAEKRIKTRKKLANQLEFPFSTSRAGQDGLIAILQKNFPKMQPILIQAPTGLGKTIGILYPVLKEAMSRGQKVIYVTPKNSQHTVAQNAIKKIQKKHNSHSMTLTAKSKLCFKTQSICNSEFCEFAKAYYTKVTNNQLLKKLRRVKNLTSIHFKKIGLDYQVCPYELQMDNIQNVDTIICDYNYAFSPHASSNRIGKLFLGEKEKPNLIIDEFHNLPERAMSYYSPILSAFTLKNWILSIEEIDIKFRTRFSILLSECSQLIEKSGTINIPFPHKINPPLERFKEMEYTLKEFLAEYLESDTEITREDIVLTLWNDWINFTSALEFVDKSSGEFFTSYYPKELAIKITCCDASSMLQKSYDPYQQIIGFSATLKPFQFYSQLSGLHNKHLKTIELPSPFSKSQRKLLIIPQVSSLYTERQRNYPRIIEIIKKITLLKKGNYFIFFPSFDFLEKVLTLYPMEPTINIIAQKRNMSFQNVQFLLTQLKDPTSQYLIFAVQGGILSEGMDYPGNMVIGAMIVDVPLPKYNWEREQMKLYYQEKYGAGLDYAYIYPAMAKSIQSSGRVIRSELDKGIIILMDHRFLQKNYSSTMPQDWFDTLPEELVSKKILQDIHQFWEDS